MIVNEDYSIENRKFEINGVKYEIVGTSVGSSHKAKDGIDQVKRIDNGVSKYYKRTELKEFQKKYKITCW